MILALFLMLAQAHEWPEKPNATHEEKCKDSCRRDHCDKWVACANLEDAAEREKCKTRTDEDETRCKRSCGESRI